MTNQRCVWLWNAPLPMSAVSTTLVMSIMVGCMVTPQAHNTTPEEVGANSRAIPDEARGIDFVYPPLGFDHTLYVHGPKSGARHDLHDLHDGATVMTGDRIHISIQTSEEAYLYLAFCTHQDLTVYPRGGIRTREGVRMVVPQGDADLVLDGAPGPEVLYVILSRRELSVADPTLAKALADKRPSGTSTDCGTNLDAKPVKDSSNPIAANPQPPGSTNVVRGTRVRKKQLPPTHARSSQRSKSDLANPLPTSAKSSSAKDNPTLAGAPSPATPPPDPDFERNPGVIVWYSANAMTDPVEVVAADDGGIAVVRYAFTHVAMASLP